MYIHKLSCLLLGAGLLVLAPQPLTAQDSNQAEWIKTKDQWGQVLFCQAIYKMPEVQTRLYDFDVEKCDEAGQIMTSAVAGYSTKDQQLLKSEAERHAYRLSHNTTQPYHSVAGCREYCREMVENQGPIND
jgi:hypothetical protein